MPDYLMRHYIPQNFRYKPMQHFNLNLCLFPQEIFWENKEKNIQTLKDKISEVHSETDLLVIPETFSTGFPTGQNKEYVRQFAEKNTGNTIDTLKSLSKEHNIAIAGSFIAETGGLLSNRAFFIEPSGDDYFSDKRHLFHPGGEDKVFSPGNKRMSVRFRGWNIAVIVCFDLRFPVWCRNIDNEYDLMIVVANWPTTRVGVWNKLLPARAIENCAYVCGVNCTGIDKNGHAYDGSSALYDFKGEDITVKIDDKGLLYASLSMEKLLKYREKFPVWQSGDKFTLL